MFRAIVIPEIGSILDWDNQKVYKKIQNKITPYSEKLFKYKLKVTLKP
jgi:hypothetical protein